MKHIPTFDKFNENVDSVNEARYWGEYNTPEGKKGAAEIEKIFSKFEEDAHKAFKELRSKLMSFKNSDLANKSGLNDTEGDAAMNEYMRKFLEDVYGIRNLNFYDFADTLY